MLRNGHRQVVVRADQEDPADEAGVSLEAALALAAVKPVLPAWLWIFLC